jgi:hypothetical protein
MSRRLTGILCRMGVAAAQLALGALAGVLLLEAVLRANPTLLLRGMTAPAPLDAPLTQRDYAVYETDADLFFWHPGLIRSVPPEADQLEARVRFATDEFGFLNPALATGSAEVVVLGRSFSLGAQAEAPWPRLLAEQTDLTVVNLSQPATSIGLKRDYLARFGLPRRPRWVIVDVLPSMDVAGYDRGLPSLVEELLLVGIQSVGRRALARTANDARSPIYPLPVDTGERSVDLVFFSPYLAALTVDTADLLGSEQWQDYTREVLRLRDVAGAGGACVALLLAPTREEIYIPLAAEPEQLAPALQAGWRAWRLNEAGRLAQDAPPPGDARTLQARASVMPAALAAFAAAHQLVWIDPRAAMSAAALRGEDPFMRYDTHWSAIGHAIVARQVASALQSAECP